MGVSVPPPTTHCTPWAESQVTIRSVKENDRLPEKNGCASRAQSSSSSLSGLSWSGGAAMSFT